jgi:hypothetical protein
MSQERWILIGLLALLAGGLSWVAKIGVIVATKGRIDDEGIAAVFFLTGVVLLVVGSTAIGAMLAWGKSLLIFLLAAACSPIVLLASFALLDAVSSAFVWQGLPTYLDGELGILVTGLTCIAIAAGMTRMMLESTSIRLFDTSA